MKLALDSDTKLEQSIKNAGNVVMPFFFDCVSQGRDETAPVFVLRDSLKKVAGTGEESNYGIKRFSKIKPYLNRFVEVAAGAGHNQLFPDTNNGVAFNQTRFFKVLKKEIRMGIFKDKIVIIGHVAPGRGDQWVTPESQGRGRRSMCTFYIPRLWSYRHRFIFQEKYLA